MKKLRYLCLLEGETETITMTDLRSQPGDVFAQIQQGKTFTVTKQGKPIAVIHSPEPTALELGAALRRLPVVKG